MNIICIGDSNTYGYDPRGPFGSRYDKPWPEQLALLTGWNVLNLGENGLEIPKKPVLFPDDTDLLIIMLGTNDLLQFWSPEAACDKMQRFLTQIRIPVLLIAPPTMTMGAWVEDPDLIIDCRTLADGYRSLSQRLGIRFADAGEWNIPLAFDGVHMTEEGHQKFAENLFVLLSKGE
jgi:lysophospholipase L1-like esterase